MPQADGGLDERLAAAFAAVHGLTDYGRPDTILRRTGGDPRLAVLWAWCPTVVLEAGNNAHVDVLGAVLVVEPRHRQNLIRHSCRTSVDSWTPRMIDLA